MNYTYLEDPVQVLRIIAELNQKAEYVVVDLETTGVDDFQDKIIDIQISGLEPEQVYIFPGSMAPALKNLTARPVGHYLKFDIKMLCRQGLDVSHWKYHDTLLMGHLLNENRESNSLDSYVKELWGDAYKEKFWARYKSYVEAPRNEALEYGTRDILYTRRLYEFLRTSLKNEQIGDSLINHVHQLQYALLQTEIRGVKVDIDYLTELGTRLTSQIEQLKPQMRKLVENEIELIELELWEKKLATFKTDKGKSRVTRPEFSFDSSRQLSDLLYTKLELPLQTNEKTGNVTVDDSALERLKSHHPVIEKLRDYRETNKVLTTYVEGTAGRLKNGLIYPEFRVNGTVTGRISHSNPNLGQLPKSGGVRGIYIPQPGHVFLSADYSQLEVCIEANLTKDKNLIKIFQDGLSKHDITAEALGIDRHAAKTLNFALQYWASHFKVAKLLKITEKEAYKVWSAYWELYSGPKKLKAETDRMVDAGEPIVNLFGRKRRFPPRKRQPWDKDYRRAYNFLIQSPGADITSKAFYQISDKLRQHGSDRALFTVHDEILIEVKETHKASWAIILGEIMVRVGHEIPLEIPLKAETSGPMTRWNDKD